MIGFTTLRSSWSSWWFGTWMDYFSIQLGMSTSQLTHIFQRGWYSIPPTRDTFRLLLTIINHIITIINHILIKPDSRTLLFVSVQRKFRQSGESLRRLPGGTNDHVLWFGWCQSRLEKLRTDELVTSLKRDSLDTELFVSPLCVCFSLFLSNMAWKFHLSPQH